MALTTERGKLKVLKHRTVYDLLKETKKMRVRMARDWKAAFDGNNIEDFRSGEVYNVPESFGKRWIEKAIAFEDKAKDVPKEIKAKKTTAKKTARQKPKR